MKRCIEGALNQLSTKVNPLGEVEHYLWGFEGDYDSRVFISEATHERIRRFLLEGAGDILRDIEGLKASDGGVPFGTRVKVWFFMEDRHDEESCWFFHIERADEDVQAA